MSAATKPSKLRRATWAARATLQEQDAEGRAVRPAVPFRTLRCGKVRFTRQPQIHELEGRAWWHGAVRCRARLCPVCWVGRRAGLAREISHVVEGWQAQHGATPQLATLTVRHTQSDGVELLKGVRTCWRAMLQGRSWQHYKKQRGIEVIAAEEVTRGLAAPAVFDADGNGMHYGDHGWHPHMHILLLPQREQSTDLHDADALWWRDKWRRIVERKLGADRVPLPQYGTDLRPCKVGQYLSKLGIELTDAAAVKGRSPFDLLRNGSVDQYLEVQLARARARDVTWSRGLRELRDSLPARPEPRTLLEPTASDFEVAARRGNLLAALEAAEQGGEDAARRALWLSVGTT